MDPGSDTVTVKPKKDISPHIMVNYLGGKSILAFNQIIRLFRLVSMRKIDINL